MCFKQDKCLVIFQQLLNQFTVYLSYMSIHNTKEINKYLLSKYFSLLLYHFFFGKKKTKISNIQIQVSQRDFVQKTSELVRLKAYDQYFSILKKIFTCPHSPLISVAFEEGLRTRNAKNLRFSPFLKYYRNQREMR